MHQHLDNEQFHIFCHLHQEFIYLHEDPSGSQWFVWIELILDT